MMDLQFPEGIKAFKPNEKAPNYIISNVVIDIEKFVMWLSDNANKYQNDGKLRLDLKLSRKDTHYLCVNTYLKKPATFSATASSNDIPKVNFEDAEVGPEEDDEEVPF